jgi:hypothetical protein
LRRSGTLTRAALALVPLLAACGDPGPVEITDVRERAASVSFRSVSTPERFGFRRPEPSARPLAWTLPAGWVEVAPSTMRMGDFRIATDPEAECYLSALPGEAGGVLANVNRWRQQMGHSALAEEQIADLPKATLLGREAVLVDLEGVYVGMGQGEARAGFRMLGLVAGDPAQTVFLKMTGPAPTVAAERVRFLGLAASIRPASAPEPPAAAGWRWTAPAEWERRPAQPMRVVTLGPPDHADVECYVTELMGAAGGIEGNINRWRQQVGQPPLDAAALEALPAVKVAGREARLVEARGTFTGMRGERVDDAALLGVVCPLEGSVLFIKMTGPAEVVAREKDRFLSFCESLQPQ